MVQPFESAWCWYETKTMPPTIRTMHISSDLRRKSALTKREERYERPRKDDVAPTLHGDDQGRDQGGDVEGRLSDAHAGVAVQHSEDCTWTIALKQRLRADHGAIDRIYRHPRLRKALSNSASLHEDRQQLSLVLSYDAGEQT
jgi:hypothetical protein